jgi:hypothetical protein
MTVPALLQRSAREFGDETYLKVPTQWVLATSEQIPTLASGKLNRKALRALVMDGTLTRA